MSVYFGNTKIGSLYLGSTKIAQAYLGSTKVYEASSVDSYNIEILYSLTDYGGAPSSTSITSSVITQDNTIMYKTASGNWVALTSEQKSSLINGYLYDVDIRGLRIQNVSPWGAFSCDISDDFESTDYSGSVTVTDSNGTQIVSSSSATFGTNLICQISNQFAVSWSGGEPYGMGVEIGD